MKIAKAFIYVVDLPLNVNVKSIVIGPLDGGKSFMDVVVKLVTDTGIVGYGEGALFPAHRKQDLAAMKEILPQLIGKDPRETNRICDLMDLIAPYLNYAKSPIDIACWDILAKSCNAPLYKLLGGKAQESFPTFACAWPGDAKEREDQVAKAKKAGFKIIQVKITGDPEEGAPAIAEAKAMLGDDVTLLIDPNTTLSIHNGLRLFDLTDRKQTWHLEQPCATMEACKRLQRECSRLLLLDENITGLNAILQAHALDVGDVYIFKIGRFGGLTRAKQARDLVVLLDRCLRIDGYAASDIENAALAHLAISTPVKNLYCAYDLAYHQDVRLADDGPVTVNGRMRAPEGPGLGITVKEELLGEPVFSC